MTADRTTLEQIPEVGAGFAAILRRLAGSLLVAALSFAAATQARAEPTCPGPDLKFTNWAEGVWWIEGAAGEADADNRGLIANLLLVRSDGGLWLVGSGPSPAVGAAVACRAARVAGLPVSDVLAPIAKPELVLGQRAFAGARIWSHPAIADAMRQRCARCVERLRARLGRAASDLDGDPVVVPDRLLSGKSGRVGPFSWWLLARAPEHPLLVLRLADRPLWFAPGLLWSGPPPDGRDADLALMLGSTRSLPRLAAADGDAARWLPEQGPPGGGELAELDSRYWAALLAAAGKAIEDGSDETAPAPALPGFPSAWSGHLWHGFNWQRAWREVEDRELSAPTTKP